MPWMTLNDHMEDYQSKTPQQTSGKQEKWELGTLNDHMEDYQSKTPQQTSGKQEKWELGTSA